MELDYSQDEINIDYGDGETQGRDQVDSNTNNQEEGGPLGQSVIRFRMQNCSRLFCAGVYVFVQGGPLTPIQDDQVILLCPIQNNDIGDDDDYPS